jgi:hypothetical protein
VAGPVQLPKDVHTGGWKPDHEAQFVGLDPDTAELQPEKPQLETGRENRRRRHNDDRRDEPHEQFRRPSATVQGIARVVTHEAIAGGSHLQCDWRNHEKAQQKMLGKQTLDAEDSDAQQGKQDKK